ncbi:MAG: peptidylprolyl isomerase [Kineosporiaceae bacterium]
MTVDTTCGPLLVSLDGAKAPKAVASLVFLAKKGYFDDTPCHRLTTSGIYVLQCGDPTGTGQGKPGYSFGPVENAPKGDLYPAGTIAMARQRDNGSSMGSQFFLVYKDSTIPSDAAGGYTIMGKVTGGLDVLEKVAAGGVADGAGDGAPARAVSITGTTVAEG